METSNEIKAVSQYYGLTIAKFENMKNCDSVHWMLNDIKEGGSKITQWRLCLKPLSAITDEDAIEVAKISKCKYCIADISDLKPHLLRAMSHSNVWSGNTLLIVCQFLQSKGYDLPNYLLGGKTLKECNLAVYEIDHNN